MILFDFMLLHWPVVPASYGLVSKGSRKLFILIKRVPGDTCVLTYLILLKANKTVLFR